MTKESFNVSKAESFSGGGVLDKQRFGLLLRVALWAKYRNSQV